jgi:hypothetical protein
MIKKYATPHKKVCHLRHPHPPDVNLTKKFRTGATDLVVFQDLVTHALSRVRTRANT